MKHPRRVLLANELGAPLDALRRLVAVGDALRGRATSVLYALPDLDVASRVLGAGPVPFVQAPRAAASAPHAVREPTPAVPPGSPPPSTDAAQRLADHGFDTAEHLVAQVNGWRGLFSLWPPDALVAVDAPAAVLAARTVGLPAVLLVTAPAPDVDARVLPDDAPGPADAAVVDAINAVLDAAQRPPIRRVAQLASCASIVTSGASAADPADPRIDGDARAVLDAIAAAIAAAAAPPAIAPAPGVDLAD